MKAQELITNIGKKTAFVTVSTAKAFVETTAGCATVAAVAATPYITAASVWDKIEKGKWNVKKNASAYIKSMATASAVIIAANTASTLVGATVCAITAKPKKTEEPEVVDSYDDFTFCEED